MRLKLTLILLFFSGMALQAQPDALSFHNLTRKEQLLEGWNWYVYKDSRGFVWISSVYGLNRFDGVNVRVFTHDDAAPCTLFGQNIQGRFFEDANSDIWFCTYEAIHCYRRKLDCFEHYYIEKESGPVNAGYFVFDLDGKEHLWFLLDEKETWTFDTRSKCFAKQDDSKASRCLTRKDASGNVDMTAAYLLGNPGLTLTRYLPGGKREKKEILNGLEPAGAPKLKTRHCLFDGDTCWIASDAGLIEYHLNTGHYQFYDHFENRNIEYLGYVGHYSADVLIITSNKGYLLFFDKKNRRFVRRFEHRQEESGSLRPSGFSNAYTDDWGNIWVSMSKNGVDWSHPGKIQFKTITPFPAGVGDLFSITTTSTGALWGSTRNSVWHFPDFPNQGYTSPALVVSDTGKFLLEIASDKGMLWAITPKSLLQYDPEKTNWRLVHAMSDLPNDYFYQLKSLRKGGLIALAFRGLRQLNTSSDGTYTLNVIPAVDSTAAYAGVFEDSKGRLFIGQNNAGICLLQPKGNSWDSLALLPVKGNPHCWYEDTASNTLWIGTSLGLVRMNLTDFSFRTYARKDGFPDHNIFSLLADGAGRLWMGTNNGLVLFDPATNHVRSFSRADGLPEEGFTPGLARRLPSGELLFGCGPRLLVVQPQAEKNLLPKPLIQITGIRVNDEAPFGLRCALSQANNPEEFQRIVLPWHQNTLSFDFTAIEYSDPARNQTLFRLTGYDDHWLSGGNPGFVRYPNLPTGSYNLLLLAANSNGDWMDQPKALEIVILPPWWQTWWFRTAAIALLLLLTYGIYRYRLAQLMRLQQMRNQIAEDLHDEVGSAITGIRMFSDSVKMELGQERPDLVPSLERIGGSATKIMGSIRDIVWAINPATDRLVDLADRMRDAATACEAAGLTYRFSAPGLSEHLRVNPKVKHNLLLIFKEALSNALKYAEATHLDMSLQVEGKQLTLSVRDNGKGFDAATVRRGNGLYNIEKRAAAIHAEFSLESRPAYGTAVVVVVRV